MSTSATNMHTFAKRTVKLVPWPVRRYVKRAPGIAPLQRWLVRRYLDGTTFVHQVDAGPAKGVRFEISLPGDKAIWTGTYEQSLAQQIADAVRPGAVCYDIGGWHGFFTGVMAAHGAKEVFVFEPLPDNIRALKKVAALNPEHRITVHPVALGEETGVATLCLLPATSMAKLADSPFESDTPTESTCSVVVDTVDRLVSSGQIPPPDLIKLDVEGAELMVLHGARETLSTAHPRIFAEIHTPDLLREVTSFLDSLGYAVKLLQDAHVDGRSFDASVIEAVPRAEHEYRA